MKKIDTRSREYKLKQEHSLRHQEQTRFERQRRQMSARYQAHQDAMTKKP